ncbi:MAG: hypothetical protein E7431_05035 [Ruminococcaceae bacterium]|nr:hypothetical protein [Oscillospiraceae bacterium]
MIIPPSPHHWDEPIVPSAPTRPALTLYLPSLGRELTLRRNRIRFGSSKFRDLDLSHLPGGRFLSADHGEFLLDNGTWQLKIGPDSAETWLGNQILAPGIYPLNPGDCILPAGREVLIVRDFGREEFQEQQLLNSDLQLSFESIHLTNGHIGREIRYDAQRRVAFQRSWGMTGKKPVDSTPEELPIPLSVNTKPQLFAYIRQHKPWWRLDFAPDDNGGEDVLLWLAPDADIRYVSSLGKVLHRQWLRENTACLVRENWHDARLDFFTEQDLRRLVRRRYPTLPLSRSGDLDDDMLLVNSGRKVTYIAERREVVCTENPPSRRLFQGKFPAPQQEAPQVLKIPAHITEHNELLWYISYHRRSWLPFSLHEDRMFRDAVLFSGRRRQDGLTFRWETRYDAEHRCVYYNSWIDGSICDGDTILPPLRIPYHIHTMKDVAAYVARQQPFWTDSGKMSPGS